MAISRVTTTSANWTPAHTVTCITIGGLGNRLRGLATSLILAEELRFGFNAIWDDSWHDNWMGDTHFLDLFENPGLCFLRSQPNCRDQLFTRTQVPWVEYELATNLAGTTTVNGSLLLDRLPQSSFCLATWDNLKPSSISVEEFCRRKHWFLSTLRPLATIQSSIDAIVDCFHATTVGVHIRRTDFAHIWRDKKHPDLELYVAAMQACIADETATDFYVATDDRAALEAMYSAFGDRILTAKDVLEEEFAPRHTKSGQRGAVIDLYCLSKTRKLIGTKLSTFSYEAASLGGIELVEISSDST